jgi:hypothetical protein
MLLNKNKKKQENKITDIDSVNISDRIETNKESKGKPSCCVFVCFYSFLALSIDYLSPLDACESEAYRARYAFFFEKKMDVYLFFMR